MEVKNTFPSFLILIAMILEVITILERCSTPIQAKEKDGLFPRLYPNSLQHYPPKTHLIRIIQAMHVVMTTARLLQRRQAKLNALPPIALLPLLHLPQPLLGLTLKLLSPLLDPSRIQSSAIKMYKPARYSAFQAVKVVIFWTSSLP